MSDGSDPDAGLTPDQLEYSYLVRQEDLVSFGIEAVLYGIHACLIFFLLYFFWTNAKQQRSSKIVTILIVGLFLLRTVQVVCDWFTVWRAFILHGTSGLGALETLLWNDPPALLAAKIQIIMTVLISGVADSIIIWRCWVICDTWLAIIIPVLLNVGSIVSGLVQFGLLVSPVVHKVTAAQLDAWGTANVALSVGTTVVSTLIIVIRILRVTRLPGSKLSSSVVEIIVESAALYAVSSLVYVGLSEPTSMTSDVRFVYAQVLSSTTAAVSPALIMLRVVMGRARPNAEWNTSEKMSAIRFEANSGHRSAILHEYNGTFNNSRDLQAGSSTDQSQVIETGSKDKEMV